ncbi:rhomboid family intramembrane serine protease [Flectobacillus major]|jgi:membrane associated rhomboid family serine protease|uniref:rhomboid family intramembrane serine protease n=1 Tax=Flectobacillus major TaxID=103 RepID=UPI0004050ECE|nr:rhomboid family intramembrane serine protease [Flectobacillus major]
MSGILEDFKDAFAKRNNGLVQLIWLNVAVYVTTLLLFVILTVFFKQGTLYYDLLEYVNLSPALNIVVFRPWTLLTYAFLHDINPIVHIFPNMLMLYWFGNIIQEFLGSKRLINLYILGAVFGGLLTILAFNLIPYYHDSVNSVTIIGASGSVLAIVFAAATLVPDYSFYLFLIGPVRIKYIAFFLLLISLAGSIGANAGGGIVHLGGALLGYIYIKQLQAGRDFGAPIDAIVDFFQGLFRRTEKPKIKVAYRQKESTYSGSISNHAGFPDDDEVDEILDKISRSGYESLTKEEKQKLFKASQK